MTLDEAKKLNLDVFFYNNPLQRRLHLVPFRGTGRVIHEFAEIISHTQMLCAAIGPRPDAGKIARAMKAAKAS